MCTQYKEVYGHRDLFIVNWDILLRCNYDCSYCYTGRHDTTGKIPTVEEIIVAAERLVSNIRVSAPLKQIKISITGGEPYLVKHIEKLFARLKQLGCIVGVISNGSATVKSYINSQVDELVFSWHFESDKDKHMKTVLTALTNRPQVYVKIMNHLSYRERVANAVEFCKNNRINYTVKDITIPVVNIE